MPTLFTRRTPVAATAATALAAAALALLPAGASQGATTSPTLQWGVSAYLDQHLSSQSFTDGASEDATTGVVTFTQGTGTRSGGTADVHYGGTARYAFAYGGSEVYSITVSDPEVVVDATGAGQLKADVAWAVPSQGVAGSVDDAVLTTFTGATWTGDAFTATPDWSGVAPADTYGTGKPVDGASWAVDFVKAVPSSLNPFFYASGNSSDALKAPAAFTAQAVTPSVTVTTTSSSTAGVGLQVAGTGFTPVTNPGDAGVYVGLAPSGGLPDVTTQEGMSAFAASAWIQPGGFADGAFTATLTAAAAKLDRTKSYSVYTWQAHTHSNTTQDTETPVSIDWATVFPAAAPTTPAASTLATSYKKAPTTTTRGKLVVDLGATATGKVKVTLKHGRTTKKAKATLAGGTATVKLPKLAQGRWKVTVAYAGDATHQAATATSKVKVKK